MKIPAPYARRRARIEVIPLIDIVFFLLATFVMVSLSMVKFRGITVDLPAARTAANTPPDTSDVILSIAADGQVSWNLDPVTLEALPDRLNTLHRDSPDARVVINGDADSRLGTALAVLDATRLSGLTRVQFQTRPGDPPNE